MLLHVVTCTTPGAQIQTLTLPQLFVFRERCVWTWLHLSSLFPLCLFKFIMTISCRLFQYLMFWMTVLLRKKKPIFYRISFCLESFPVFLLLSWLLDGLWQNGTARMFLMESVWCSLFYRQSSWTVYSSSACFKERKNNLSVCSKFSSLKVLDSCSLELQSKKLYLHYSHV